MTDTIFSADELNASIQSGHVTPNLPPPGAARNEILAQRKDALEQRIDELSDLTDSVSTAALRPDRDILHDISRGFLDVVKPNPAYVYKWVNYINQHGSAVWQAKAELWEVVDSPSGESAHLRKEDNSRRVGDVLLMRRRMDHDVMFQQRQAQQRQNQYDSADAELNDIVGKHPDALILRPDLSNRVESRAQRRMTAQRVAATHVAKGHLGNLMKSGPIPGVPLV